MAKIISIILLVVSILGFGWWAFHSIGQLQSANKQLQTELDLAKENELSTSVALKQCFDRNDALQKELDSLRVGEVKNRIKDGKPLKGMKL